MARPSIYTKELATLICSRIAAGESLRAICRGDEMPDLTTVMEWRLRDREGFSQQYAQAREIQAEVFGDELQEIVDDGTNDWMEIRDKKDAVIGWRVNGEAVQRSRLRFDARRWWMSKVLPKQYGEKLTVAGDPNAPLGVQLIHSVPQPDRGEE